MMRDLAIDNASHQDLAETVSTLFQHYAKPVCAYIHSLVDDWELAYDLTQETYLRLHQARDRLPTVENQRAWVYRIATNLAINESKRRRCCIAMTFTLAYPPVLPWRMACGAYPARPDPR